MRWRRRHWPERQPRPEARTLTDDEREKLLTTMTREIAASPVLTGLGLQVHLRRGRFYLERPFPEGAVEGTEAWGRITPLDDAKGTLLLEQDRGKSNWHEIARGSARTLIKTIAGDTKGTFHGLGALDKALRQAGQGLVRLPVKREAQANFVYAETGVDCSAQEALFHHFGLPLHVLVEPSEWYSYHRKPTIVEGSEDRTRVLVRFGAMSSSGESFGGTCLYACREGNWAAYRIRPSESRDITTAEAWLVKRKWKQWGS
jgi:hypothetical protein